MRMRAIGDVRKGADPGTDWTIQNYAHRRGREADRCAHNAEDAVDGSRAPAGDRADRSGAADLDPGLLRDAGDRRDRQAAIATAAWPRRMSSSTWAARAAAVEAYRSAPTPNVIVLEATADRDTLIEQLDELAQYCDAGTKVDRPRHA